MICNYLQASVHLFNLITSLSSVLSSVSLASLRMWRMSGIFFPGIFSWYTFFIAFYLSCSFCWFIGWGMKVGGWERYSWVVVTIQFLCWFLSAHYSSSDDGNSIQALCWQYLGHCKESSWQLQFGFQNTLLPRSGRKEYIYPQFLHHLLQNKRYSEASVMILWRFTQCFSQPNSATNCRWAVQLCPSSPFLNFRSIFSPSRGWNAENAVIPWNF